VHLSVVWKITRNQGGAECGGYCKNWQRAVSTSGTIVGRMLNLSAVITATALDWIPLVCASGTNSEQTASNGNE
jgi:hypothetical protein